MGGDRRARRVRHEDAEGGDERGDPRLDHERRDDALRDRLVRRPGAVPRDRARAAGGDRPRGARAAARGRRRAAGGRRRLRRRRLERDRDVRRLHRRRRRAADRGRGGGRCIARGRPHRRAARLALVDPRRRGRPDRRRALDLGRARLPGRRSRARVPPRHRPRRVPPVHRRGGPGGVPAALARSRGSFPRSSRRTRSRWWIGSMRSTSPCASLAEGTRIWQRCWLRSGRRRRVEDGACHDQDSRHLPDGRSRDPRARRGRGRRRRRHHRDRLPVLRSRSPTAR